MNSSAAIQNNSYLLEVRDGVFKLLWALWLHLIRVKLTAGNVIISVILHLKLASPNAKSPVTQTRRCSRAEPGLGLAARGPSDSELLQSVAGELCQEGADQWVDLNRQRSQETRDAPAVLASRILTSPLAGVVSYIGIYIVSSDRFKLHKPMSP